MAGSDKSKQEWALIRYLRAVTVAGLENDDLAEALYKAQEVYTQLGRSEKAEGLKARLRKECANSPWSKK